MGWTTIIFGSFVAVSAEFSLFSFRSMTPVSVEQMNSSVWKILELDSFVGSNLYCSSCRLFLSSSLILFSEMLTSLIVFSGLETSDTVNVRTRDNKVHGEKSLSALLERFWELKLNKKADSEEEF